MRLLIHADPGARSGLVGAWLNDMLNQPGFDIGKELQPQFYKIHTLDSLDQLTNWPRLKIRIRPTIETIDLHSMLLLKKNFKFMYSDIVQDEYSLSTFSKLATTCKEFFVRDAELDYSLYHHVIGFKDTFDVDTMIELYKSVNRRMPLQHMIDMLVQTNQLNKIVIEKNHACSILKLIMFQEHIQNLKEENRFWSIVDIYNTVPREQLYDTVSSLIHPGNYGIFLQQ